MKCLNLSNPKIQELVKEFGEAITAKVLDGIEDYIPSVEEVRASNGNINNIVRYNHKVLSILVDSKSQVIIGKAIKNNWTLDKLGAELQIPKDQMALLKESEGNTLGEKLASFLANYSYTIEINTAKDSIKDAFGNVWVDEYPDKEIGDYITIDNKQWKITGKRFEDDSWGESGLDVRESFIVGSEGENTQHYSNLTVPGGTNYTENEIATPDITPSIKGHAQFATDKGIGWFRSDDKATDNLDAEKEIKKQYAESGLTIPYEQYKLVKGVERGGIVESSKTRRILEVQSDLFQKGRDKNELINFEKERNKELNRKLDNGEITEEEYFNIVDDRNNIPKNSNSNQFLQLLNKDNNWVTFFVKSIIQDSAKKGYEKVLFPTGSTASKVEGHTTLEEFKKQKENRIKELEKQTYSNFKSFNIEAVHYTTKDNKFYKQDTTKDLTKIEINEKEFKEAEQIRINEKLENNKKEINQLKQELERVETEGFGALRPIYNFYENTVTAILRKQGYSPKLVTDEYGNTWNEITVETARDEQAFAFKLNLNPDALVDLVQPDLVKVQSYIDKVVGRAANVQYFNPLLNNIDRGNIVWGQVVGSTMYLANQAPAGIEYHEAFHLVFRNMFTNDDIFSARQLARRDIIAELKTKGTTLEKELVGFRAAHSSRAKLSDVDLKNLYYEEWLADRFQEWKMSKIADKQKSKFRRFFEAILNFIGILTTPSISTELDSLFYDIDNGAYAKDSVVNNVYTSGRNTTSAFKLVAIDISKDGEVLLHEPAERTEEKKNILAALALADIVDNTTTSLEVAINEALDTLASEYSLSNKTNMDHARSLKGAERVDFLNYLKHEELALTHPTNRDIYKEKVLDMLRRINVSELDSLDEEDPANGDIEDSTAEGMRFDIDWSTVGGLGGASKDYKEWIATTLFTRTDRFGISRTAAVNLKMVYQGLLKANAQFDPSNPALSILRSSILLAQKSNNPDIHAFILGPTGLVAKLGLDIIPLMEDGVIAYDRHAESDRLLNLFVSQNMKSHVVTRFLGIDTKRGSFYKNENQEDVDSLQLSNWHIEFRFVADRLTDTRKTINGKRNTSTGLANMVQKLTTLTSRLTIGKFDKNTVNSVQIAEEVQTLLDTIVLTSVDGVVTDNIKDLTGISLSPMFVEFLLLKEAAEVYGYDRLNEAQLSFLDSYSSKVKFTDLANLKELLTIVGETSYSAAVKNMGVSPFERRFETTAMGEERETNADSNVITRASKLAKDNAVFDPLVNLTTYRTADGKNRHSLQFTTQNLRQVVNLRKPAYIAKLKEEAAFRDTYLLNSEEFLLVHPQLDIERVGSAGVTSININDEGTVSESNVDRQERIPFKDMDGTALTVWSLNSFIHATVRTVATVSEGKKTVVTAPLFLNVMETSATGEILELPYKDYEKDGQFRQEYVDAMAREIMVEVNRIAGVAQDVARQRGGEVLENSIPKWNTVANLDKSDPENIQRQLLGLQPFFFTNFFQMNEDLAKLLVMVQRGGEVTIDAIKPFIREYLEYEYSKFMENLAYRGLITREVKDGIVNYTVNASNGLLDVRYYSKNQTKEAITLNPDAGLVANLKKYFAWDYLNRISATYLFYGDPSKMLLKDNGAFEFARRVKASNGSGEPALPAGRKFRMLTLDREPTDALGNKVMDAQTYANFTFLKEMQKTSGKRVSPEIARIYNQVQNGKRLTDPKDLKLLKELDAIINGYKLQYFGGEVMEGMTTIKASTVFPKRVDHSYKDPKTGDWVAIPGHEFAHNMLALFETDEPVILGPTSAFKTFVKGQVSTAKIQSGEKTSIEAKDGMIGDGIDLKIQLHNPSNKTHIKAPSVVEQIITSELKSKAGKEVADQFDTLLKVGLAVREAIKLAGLSDIETIKSTAKNLATSGGTDQQLALLEVNGGQRLYNPNLEPISQAIERRKHTEYNDIWFPKIPGYKFTLESDFIHPKLVMPDGTIITTEAFQSNPAKYIEEGIRSESLQLKTEVINGQTVYYAEAKMAPHFIHQLKSKGIINDALEMSFGLRIPTSDKHSMVTIKIVDYIDASNGSQLILPAELIGIIGHDFDIDAFYVHRKEFYEASGQTVLYGTAGSIMGEFSEFITYIQTESNVSRFVLERLEAHKEFQDLKIKIKETRALLNSSSISESDYSDESDTMSLFLDSLTSERKQLHMSILLDVLKDIKLPHDVESYKVFKANIIRKSKSGYKGSVVLPAIYNQQLDLKIKIHSLPDFNEPQASLGGKTINTVPESPDLFLDIAGNIASLRTGEAGISHVDELAQSIGAVQTMAFQADVKDLMSSGQKAIGVFVNTATIFSIFNRHGVQPLFKESGGAMPIVLGTTSYNDFSDLNSKTDGYPKVRILDSLSTGTVSSTDNWKTLVITYFGLLGSNLTKFTYLLTRGVSPELLLQMLATEGVMEYTKETLGSVLKSNSEARGGNLSKKQTEELIKKYSSRVPSTIEISPALITRENVEALLKASAVGGIESVPDQASRDLLNATQAAILEFWVEPRLGAESFTFARFASILKMNKKQESEFEYSENVLNAYDELTDEEKAIFDLGQLEGKHFFKQSIDLMSRLHKEGASMFLKQVGPVKDFRESILSRHLSQYQKNTKQLKKELSRDLVSFLAVTAYKKHLESDPQGKEILDQLNLGLVMETPQSRERGVVSVYNKYGALFNPDRKAYKANTYNVFLRNLRPDYKSIVVDDSTTAYSSILRLLGGFSVMNKEFQGLLTDSAHEALNLNKDLGLRETLIAYMIVKDGLQMKPGSPLGVLPPSIFRGLSIALDSALDLFNRPYTSEDVKAVFGMTLDELFHEFLSKWMRDSRQSYRMKSFSDSNFKIQDKDGKDVTLFNLFNDGILNTEGVMRVTKAPIKGKPSEENYHGKITIDLYAGLFLDPAESRVYRASDPKEEKTKQRVVDNLEDYKKIVKQRKDLMRSMKYPIVEFVTMSPKERKAILGRVERNKGNVMIAPHSFIYRSSEAINLEGDIRIVRQLYTISSVDGKTPVYNAALGGYAGQKIEYQLTTVFEKGPSKISVIGNTIPELEKHTTIVTTGKERARKANTEYDEDFFETPEYDAIPDNLPAKQMGIPSLPDAHNMEQPTKPQDSDVKGQLPTTEQSDLAKFGIITAPSEDEMVDIINDALDGDLDADDRIHTDADIQAAEETEDNEC